MYWRSLLIVVFIATSVLADTRTITATRDYKVGETTSFEVIQPTRRLEVSSPDSSSEENADAITSCHFHGATQYCVNADNVEGYVSPIPSSTEDAPSSYTGCHSHDEETFCLASSGDEVEFVTDESHSHNETSSTSASNFGNTAFVSSTSVYTFLLALSFLFI